MEECRARLRAIHENPEEHALPAPTDANLKKSTAMVNRLKNITGDQAAKLCDDLTKLKCAQFLPEFVSSITESVLKYFGQSGKDAKAADIAGHLDVRSRL